MSKRPSIFLILTLGLLASSSAYAQEENTIIIKEQIKEVIEKHKLEKQEFKPILFEEDDNDDVVEENFQEKKLSKVETNKKSKSYDMKNEFFESIKVIFSSDNDYKIIYMNPYEKLEAIALNSSEEYKIKVFDLNENYLGNLINTNLKKQKLLKISPFLLFPELSVKSANGETARENIIHRTAKPRKIEIDSSKRTIRAQELSEIIKPKSIQVDTSTRLDPLEPESFQEEKKEIETDQFKITNISNYDVKVTIKKASGESIGTYWIIDNDTYSPELLKFAAKAITLEKDTQITIQYLNQDESVKEEISFQAQDIQKDQQNNYTYFVEDLSQDEL